MKDNSFETPAILIIAFNRPNTTEKLINAIRKSKPKKIFFAVDGPRKNNKDDEIKVAKVKKLLKKIDWKCKIKTHYGDKNLGCPIGGNTAIKWFFENVKEGIIFDDDCIPTEDFFRFCAEMLEKYRDDKRVMHISGYNIKRKNKQTKSYYFSNYPYIWGWASWSRAYGKYDFEMKSYPEFKKKNCLKEVYPSFIERKYIKYLLDLAYKNPESSGDMQWIYAMISNGGLSIVPNKNLINYIGFEKNASNTKKEDSFLYSPPQKLNFPLVHPSFMICDREKDIEYINYNLKNKIKKKFLKLLRLIKSLP